MVVGALEGNFQRMLKLYTDEREDFMDQFIIVNGSKIIVPTPFLAYTLIVPPLLTITGTGQATVGGQPVCQEGDEKLVIGMCSYTIGSYTTPGTVTITISEAKTAAYVSSLKPVITAPQWKVKCTRSTQATLPPPSNLPDLSPPQEMMVSVTGNPNTFVSVEG